MQKPLGIVAALALASCAFAQSPAGTPVVWSNILDESVYVGKPCSVYNNGYYNVVTGHLINCVNTGSFAVSIQGVWTVITTGGGAGSAVWGGITGTLSNQGDLATALNAKQNALTLPLTVANGGTGSTGPSLIAGANVTITGTWPNQTIAATGGGSGGSVAWGSITGSLSAQTDLQSQLNLKQNALTLPLSVANGGNGTATPALVAGTNVTISGTWPNQTINASGGGGGAGVPSGTTLPATCIPGTDTLFFKSNGTVNQQVYTCSATNTWTLNMLLGGTGALAINGSSGALDIVTSVVPRLAVNNGFTGRNLFSNAVDFTLQASPANPAAGTISLYANTDGTLHYKNNAGTDAALATGAGFANPMTTQDDVIIGGASGVPTRLAKGADNQVLGIDPGTHHLTYINGGGGGTSGLANTQVLFGGGTGSIAQDSRFTYDSTGHRLTIDTTGDPSGSNPGQAITLQSTDTSTNALISTVNTNASYAGTLGISGHMQSATRNYFNNLGGPSHSSVANTIYLVDAGTGPFSGKFVYRILDAQYRFGANIQMQPEAAQPTCDATTRGTWYYTNGGAGVADTSQLCMKNASDAYAWVTK